jgi:cell fate (sporulation/competence/biofilm development) regulator YmcA (YheA/YmcA/DUF963 family)
MNTNKMELIKELEYVTNYQTLGNKLMKWGKESSNEEIKECKGCLAEIGIYVAHLEYERRTYEKTIESYRSDKVRALKRARRVEAELNEANKIVIKYNKAKKLGL